MVTRFTLYSSWEGEREKNNLYYLELEASRRRNPSHTTAWCICGETQGAAEPNQTLTDRGG